MKALITGAAGFIGRHFLDEMRSWSVDVCDPRRYGNEALADLFSASTTQYDLVVHAAAREPHRVAIDRQPTSHVYNQLLDAAMFDWAIRTGQRHVLYLSSCAVLDEHPDAYGLLKLTGERMAEQARAAGVAVSVVRPFSGYGEDQGTDWPFGAFVARARARQDPFEIWGDGTQVRDWIHVDDLVGAALTVVDADVTEPVEICTGIGTSMLELAAMMCERVGYSPTFALQLDASAGAARRVGDPTKLHQIYTPKVDLAEGVHRALLSGSEVAP